MTLNDGHVEVHNYIYTYYIITYTCVRIINTKEESKAELLCHMS
jgi:hypothetical protein